MIHVPSLVKILHNPSHNEPLCTSTTTMSNIQYTSYSNNSIFPHVVGKAIIKERFLRRQLPPERGNFSRPELPGCLLYSWV